MKAIIAKNNLSFIGFENKLLWHCTSDLKLFKELTLGNSCSCVSHEESITNPENIILL